MKHLRGAAVLLVMGGVLVCTAGDRVALPPPAALDGYYVLAGDFHVHTAFGDGGLAPWDARREAQRQGLDVIAVTNHNHLIAAQLHRRWFRSTHLPLVLIGQEVTAPAHHILGIGISSRIDWDQSAAQTIAAIQAQGGVAIAAHPTADSARDFDAAALARLDAAERTHPGMKQSRDEVTDRAPEYEAFFARARLHNPRLSPVGDSDFHFIGAIGLCRTYVLARETTEAGVLDALRSGRAVAYDANGRAYGDDALIELVERARRARPSRPSMWVRRASTGGAVLAWVGVAALVLLGPPARPSRANR